MVCDRELQNKPRYIWSIDFLTRVPIPFNGERTNDVGKTGSHMQKSNLGSLLSTIDKKEKKRKKTSK
jgi:hypothetical protein